MRIVSRTTRGLREEKREKALRRRAAAGSLQASFPRVEVVRIHLRFFPVDGPPLAAQTHALYASADAFFEFGCPYGDCDGDFDLNGDVSILLERSGRHAEGAVRCSGSRIDGMTRRPCRLRADFWIAAEYGAISRAV